MSGNSKEVSELNSSFEFMVFPKTGRSQSPDFQQMTWRPTYLSKEETPRVFFSSFFLFNPFQRKKALLFLLESQPLLVFVQMSFLCSELLLLPPLLPPSLLFRHVLRWHCPLLLLLLLQATNAFQLFFPPEFLKARLFIDFLFWTSTHWDPTFTTTISPNFPGSPRI